MTDAKYGVSGLGESLKSTSVDGLGYLFFENGSYSIKKVSALLPAFDEYLVGYSESRDIAFQPDIDKSFLGNGIFKPVVVSDSTIAGIWKRISHEPYVEVQSPIDMGSYSDLNPSLHKFSLFSGLAEEKNNR